MANIRVFFDLDSLGDSDYQKVQVWELESPGGFGTLIDTILIKAGADYVESTLATDPFKWFVLKVQDSTGMIIAETDAVLAEVTQVLIDRIRRDLKDTSEDDPGFSDEELMEKLRMAALRHNRNRNLGEIKDDTWQILMILVRIDCCYVLAYDFAKYLKLEIPGGASLSKDELYRHYLEIAKQLEEYYAKIRADLADDSLDDSTDVHDLHVSTMKYDRSEV